MARMMLRRVKARVQNPSSLNQIRPAPVANQNGSNDVPSGKGKGSEPVKSPTTYYQARRQPKMARMMPHRVKERFRTRQVANKIRPAPSPTKNGSNDAPSGEGKGSEPVKSPTKYYQPPSPTKNGSNDVPSGEGKGSEPIKSPTKYYQPPSPTKNGSNDVPSGKGKGSEPVKSPTKNDQPPSPTKNDYKPVQSPSKYDQPQNNKPVQSPTKCDPSQTSTKYYQPFKSGSTH
ncbi:hypothetical protein MHU86_17364 [Fragilaria crotonensis]|nr:hypothetical protein MHU86_17364 [Fragilaria crotonensis]